MATEVVMPQMGESIAEGTITRWLVPVGSTVERDQPLFEISTDKVDAEIPSPAAGVLLEVRHGEGETVEVNQVVALIGKPGEETAPMAAQAPAAAPADGSAGEPEAVVASEGSDESGVEPDAGPADTQEAKTLEERLRRFSSPLVRSIAAKEGVDITRLQGTGIHGRVTKADIQAYLERRGTEAAAPASKPSLAPAVPAPAPAGGPAPSPKAARPAGDFHVPAFTEGENVRIEPMSKIRQITAAHMAYSKATSAHVTTVFHVDLTRVDRMRRQARDRFLAANGTKLTFMPFIFKALAGALKLYPQLNAAIDGTDVVYKRDVNLGMAVALDRGLIVPVLRHADQLSLVGLARTANDLADRARTKKLSPDEVKGGTFTVTNPGVFGSLFGTPVINQPQVAILGIGTIEKRPVVVTDEDGSDALAIRTMCYFALTFDHRLIDGADADHFMAHLRRTLETESWSELEVYA